jgi:hypothetical protein
MFDRHTTVIIFNMLTKLLNVLYVNWHAKLIDMSLDNEKMMTNCFGGLITLIIACTKNNVLRIWCSPHHIDIVVKSATKDINAGMWVKFAYMFSVLLRVQNNLIINMGVKCLKKTNRWVHLGRLFNFLK